MSDDKKRHRWSPARFLCLDCGAQKIGVRIDDGSRRVGTFRTRYKPKGAETFQDKAPPCERTPDPETLSEQVNRQTSVDMPTARDDEYGRGWNDALRVLRLRLGLPTL